MFYDFVLIQFIIAIAASALFLLSFFQPAFSMFIFHCKNDLCVCVALQLKARLADDVVYEVGSAIDSVLDDDDDDEYDDDQYEGKSSSKSQGGAQLQSQSQSQSQSEQRQRRVSGKQRPGRRRRSRFSSPDAFLRTATKAATKAAAAVRGALATEFDPPPSEIEALVSNQYAIPVKAKKPLN
jgi:hypothetical protein